MLFRNKKATKKHGKKSEYSLAGRLPSTQNWTQAQDDEALKNWKTLKKLAERVCMVHMKPNLDVFFANLVKPPENLLV